MRLLLANRLSCHYTSFCSTDRLDVYYFLVRLFGAYVLQLAMALVLLDVDSLGHHDALVMQYVFLGFDLSNLRLKELFGLF